MSDKTKIVEIKKLIYGVFDILDKSGKNTKKYKDLFEPMSDEKFLAFMKKLVNSPDEFLYLEVMPFENEPVLADVIKACNFLKIPTEEYIYTKDTATGKPVRYPEKALTGYNINAQYKSL
jgi:hypothetical protein